MTSTALLLGVREAAAMLGVSHWTLRDYIRSCKLGSVRIGRRVLLEPAELQRLIDEGRQGVRL